MTNETMVAVAKQAGHTPGPWIVHSYTVTVGSFNKGKDVGPIGRAVCTVIGAFEQSSIGDEAQANATLIAAAPDLLAALEAMLDDGDVCEVMGAEWEASARAAIAKART